MSLLRVSGVSVDVEPAQALRRNKRGVAVLFSISELFFSRISIVLIPRSPKVPVARIIDVSDFRK
jgi:hypothetical protein